MSQEKLDRRNPVEYDFDATVEGIHQAVRDLYAQQFRDKVRSPFSPVFYNDDPMPPEAKAILRADDVFLWYMHQPHGGSLVYRVNGRPAPYLGDFHLRLTRMGESLTRVRVEVIRPQILIGKSWLPGPHMVRTNIYQAVPPTSIEEYGFLLSLGRRLGSRSMPPLNLPRAE